MICFTNDIVIIKCKLLIQLHTCKVGRDLKKLLCRFMLPPGQHQPYMYLSYRFLSNVFLKPSNTGHVTSPHHNLVMFYIFLM